MEQAPPHIRQHTPNEGRRPVLSPQFGHATATITPRPGDGNDDDANTAQTVNLMREFAAIDAAAPAIQAATLEATRGAQGSAAAHSIFQWIKSRVQFQEDELTATLAGLPNDAEILIRPADILQMRQPAGDCDDFTMLAVSMLTAAGIPARIKAIEQDSDRPGFFSHVFAEAQIDGAWRAFDASHGSHIGWNATPTGKVSTWETHTMPQTLGRIPQLEAFDWGSLINRGIDITGQILVPRLSVPQTPGGSYTRMPNGAVMVSNNPTGGAFTFPGGSAATIGDNSGTILLIGAAVVIGVIAFSSRR